MHQPIMMIYSHIKFHQIPLIGYLAMAPDECDRVRDGQNDGWTDDHGENYILPPLVGDKNRDVFCGEARNSYPNFFV